MERAFNRTIEGLEGDKSRLGFGPQRAMMKVLGCFWWEKPSLIKRMYSFWFVGIQVVAVFSITSYLLNNKIKTADDFTQMINSLILLVPYIAAILKMSILHIKSSDYRKMIEFLESFPSDGVVFPRWRMFLVHNLTYLLTVGNWAIYGIIARGWPWYAAFPWDTTSLTGHCLAIVFEIVSIVPCGLSHLMISSVIVAAVAKLKPQIERLKVVFSKIGADLDENKLIVKEAVDLHSAIQRGVYLTNNAVAMIFMFKVISLVPLICINAFVITKIDDVFHIITSVLPMSLCVVAELYVFFGPGQQLVSAIENMDHVSYDNEWYTAPVHTRRDLSIIIECSRKQLSLNAYGVAYANNATLLAVVQQAYSYFLFLHTMADIIDSN